MNNTEYKLSQAQEIFKNVAFHIVAKEISTKETHSMVLEGLEILSDIEKSIKTENTKENQCNQNENNEIKKVQSRLKLWAKSERQGQINVRILNAFLGLKQTKDGCITVDDIQNELPSTNIQSNLQQMTNIAEKNHGKIFEQNVNCIEIWDPVCLFVSEYEKTIKIYSNSFHLTAYANMTKQKAIEIVNNHLQEQSLNEENTNISKINDTRDVWWFTIPPERFSNDLHLLLKKTNGLIWLKISANTIRPQDVFRLRADVDKIDLEISSDNGLNNYMVDIKKSDGIGYNFKQHIEHEFN